VERHGLLEMLISRSEEERVIECCALLALDVSLFLELALAASFYSHKEGARSTRESYTWSLSEEGRSSTVAHSCSSMVQHGVGNGYLITGASRRPCLRLLRSWDSMLTSSQHGLHCRRHAEPCEFLTWWRAEAWQVFVADRAEA